jgi:hypothetical protein
VISNAEVHEGVKKTEVLGTRFSKILTALLPKDAFNDPLVFPDLRDSIAYWTALSEKLGL